MGLKCREREHMVPAIDPTNNIMIAAVIVMILFGLLLHPPERNLCNDAPQQLECAAAMRPLYTERL